MLPPDSVWFVTGCSSGIGAAIAKHVAAQGHRLVATARNPSTLEYLPDGPHILKLPLDVCKTTSMDAALTATLDKFHRIDVLINSAGYNSVGIAEAYSEDTLRIAMETNFWGPVHLTRKAIGILRDINPKSGEIGGTVVNVTSIGGRFALPAEAAYHSSKFALEGFTEAIASELYPSWKIRMMILEPGGTKTNFTTQSRANRGPSHPAYNDSAMPVNAMIDILTNPKLDEGFPDPSEVATCLFGVLQADEIPLRLATGADAYGAIKGKDMAKMEELEKWRKVSESVGQANIDDVMERSH